MDKTVQTLWDVWKKNILDETQFIFAFSGEYFDFTVQNSPDPEEPSPTLLGSDDYKRLFRPLSRRFEKFSPVTAPILRRSVPAAFPVENVSRCVDRHSDVARAPRGCSTSLICAPSRFSRSSTV